LATKTRIQYKRPATVDELTTVTKCKVAVREPCSVLLLLPLVVMETMRRRSMTLYGSAFKRDAVLQEATAET